MPEPRIAATCPVCGSSDEYSRPDPPEHTCGHLAAPERERLESRITALENALHAYAPDHHLLEDAPR